MSDLRQTYCERCKALIVFIHTENGKYMPCDANPVMYMEDPSGESRVYTRSGKLVRCTLHCTENDFTGLGYKPHWDECIFSEGRKRLVDYKERARQRAKPPAPTPIPKAKPHKDEPKVEQLSLFTVYDNPYRRPATDRYYSKEG